MTGNNTNFEIAPGTAIIFRDRRTIKNRDHAQLVVACVRRIEIARTRSRVRAILGVGLV
jgi:hypothetical protein